MKWKNIKFKTIFILSTTLLLTSCGPTHDLETETVTTPSSDVTYLETKPSETEEPASEEEPSKPSAVAPSSLTKLETLEVKGKAADSGYDREGKYGRAWIDVDGNGCRTRDDILKRDLYNILTENGCTVFSGILEDPYTGETIFFEREKDASAVQIDHIVALKNSWLTGAQSWDDTKRIEFANDPLNLLAVDGPANQQKSASDAASWLPKNKNYRCIYVNKQIDVKAKYGLWVTPPEKEAMVNVLQNCDTASVEVTQEPVPEVTTPEETSVETPEENVPTETNLRTCKDVKAAGLGPYVKGVDPEYKLYRDGDNDGSVCE